MLYFKDNNMLLRFYLFVWRVILMLLKMKSSVWLVNRYFILKKYKRNRIRKLKRLFLDLKDLERGVRGIRMYNED